jgi:hypothetical protein
MQIVNHIIMKNGKAYLASKEHLKAEMVARLYVDGKQSIEAVMEHYGLSASEVHAALTYYYDNREELDKAHQAKLDEIRQNAQNLETFKAKLSEKK